MIKVLGISGSLRTGSYNTSALRAAIALAPEGIEIEVGTIAGIPIYNGDDEAATGIPEAAKSLADQIRAADALLIVTPEYNASVPGPLKNAIDWLSRDKPMPLSGKPTAIMGATPGLLGTARAQFHLRQILSVLDAKVVNKPEVYIGSAADRFDESGNLTHEFTQKVIRDLLTSLRDWTLQLQRGKA